MNSEERRDTTHSSDGAPFIYLIMTGVIAYAVIYLILLLGVILTVCLTAGAGYLGYKAAVDLQLWENRRIARDQKLEASRIRELEYFQSQGNNWMEEVINNHYNDHKRELYSQGGSLIDKATQTIRRVKEALK
jgi:hypothetical protein